MTPGADAGPQGPLRAFPTRKPCESGRVSFASPHLSWGEDERELSRETSVTDVRRHIAFRGSTLHDVRRYILFPREKELPSHSKRCVKRSPLEITFSESAMMSALKKNAKLVCHTTVHRKRELVTCTSETENVVAFVNEK